MKKTIVLKPKAKKTLILKKKKAPTRMKNAPPRNGYSKYATKSKAITRMKNA